MSPTPTAVVSRIALARAAAAAARGVEGVVDLDGGARGEVATYGAGERLAGVRVVNRERRHLRLRIVAAYGRDLPRLCGEVRAAVAGLATLRTSEGRPPRVDVRVVDVVAPTDPLV